jgi:hypothetical protein
MRMFATVAVLLTAVGSLSAQEGTGWLDLQGGYVKQGADSVYKASPAFGLGIGGWFGNAWGAEVSVLNTRLETKATGLKGDETHAMISGLINFNPGGTAVFPFLRLGAGIVTFKGDLKSLELSRRAEFHGGFGVQGCLGEHFLGVVEFRESRVGRRTPYRNEAMGILGLGYRWGGSARVGKASPASSEPAPPRRPMVEALPSLPQEPGVEVVPASPQRPAVEVVPTPAPKPAVEALPTPP